MRVQEGSLPITVTDGYFERIDEHRYRPTLRVAGGWDPDEQHFSPLGGLVVHAIDRLIGATVLIAGRAVARARAWFLTSLDTAVAGETVSPLASYIALVDIANGIAARQSPATWMFPNVDLTIHLHRQPHGPWTGLDTTVVFGPTGQGITSTVLHDLTGPVGHAQQILTVRPLHAAD